MNSLDIDKINLLSPYSVVCIADRLHFRTDYGIDYIVTFDLDANPTLLLTGLTYQTPMAQNRLVTIKFKKLLSAS